MSHITSSTGETPLGSDGKERLPRWKETHLTKLFHWSFEINYNSDNFFQLHLLKLIFLWKRASSLQLEIKLTFKILYFCSLHFCDFRSWFQFNFLPKKDSKHKDKNFKLFRHLNKKSFQEPLFTRPNFIVIFFCFLRKWEQSSHRNINQLFQIGVQLFHCSLYVLLHIPLMNKSLAYISLNCRSFLILLHKQKNTQIKDSQSIFSMEVRFGILLCVFLGFLLSKF